MSLGKYLKAAFTQQWNLLALMGGLGFAMLTGAPDVFVPLVLAAEIVYLGLLGTHDKFQRYVDAQEWKSIKTTKSQTAEQALQRMMRALPKETLERFERLKQRCTKLKQIASDLKQPGQAGKDASLEEVQLAGLDRLLWIYLKLLFTEYSLSRFFETTEEQRIRGEIEKIEHRIQDVAESSTSSQRQRVLETLQDNLQTCQDRLSNFLKARDNLELVQLEIERLENKIRSLSELAVNRREPDFISSQVGQVAESMLATERTISELQFVTGLHSADDEVPELIRRESVRAVE